MADLIKTIAERSINLSNEKEVFILHLPVFRQYEKLNKYSKKPNSVIR